MLFNAHNIIFDIVNKTKHKKNRTKNNNNKNKIEWNGTWKFLLIIRMYYWILDIFYYLETIILLHIGHKRYVYSMKNNRFIEWKMIHSIGYVTTPNLCVNAIKETHWQKWTKWTIFCYFIWLILKILKEIFFSLNTSGPVWIQKYKIAFLRLHLI